MGNVSVLYIGEYETVWLGSFDNFKSAEIFVEGLKDKGYNGNKIIYQF